MKDKTAGRIVQMSECAEMEAFVRYDAEDGFKSSGHTLDCRKQSSPALMRPSLDDSEGE